MVRLLTTAILASVVFAANCHAATVFTANMTNAGEPGTVIPTLTNGQPRPASFGAATLVLNDAQTQLTFFAEVFNIDFTGSQTADTNDNLVNAHIHATSTVPVPATFPVVWGFIGNPFNDNNPNDLVITPFATGVGATVSAKWDAPEGQNTTLAAQLVNIIAGRSYINFHTSQFPGGEIRGTIVPEPASLALGVIGFGALVALAARRRAK